MRTPPAIDHAAAEAAAHRAAAHRCLAAEHGLSAEHHSQFLTEAEAHLSSLLPAAWTLEDLEKQARAASERRSELLAHHPDEAAGIVSQARAHLTGGAELTRQEQDALEKRLISHKQAHDAALAALDVTEMALHDADLVARLRALRDAPAIAAAEAAIDADLAEHERLQAIADNDDAPVIDLGSEETDPPPDPYPPAEEEPAVDEQAPLDETEPQQDLAE